MGVATQNKWQANASIDTPDLSGAREYSYTAGRGKTIWMGHHTRTRWCEQLRRKRARVHYLRSQGKLPPRDFEIWRPRMLQPVAKG